jgi:hypothetical protein
MTPNLNPNPHHQECVSPEQLEAGQVFPEVSTIREVSKKIAAAVARKAIEVCIFHKHGCFVQYKRCVVVDQ